MKRSIAFIFVLLAFHQNTFSQNSFDFMLGNQWSWIASDSNNPKNTTNWSMENLAFESARDFSISLEYCVRRDKTIGVNFGVQYSPKRIREVNRSVDLKLNYLTVLQSFNINLIDNFNVGAGMFWGYNVFTHDNSSPEVLVKYDAQQDYGLHFGLKYRIKRFSLRASFFNSFSGMDRIRRTENNMIELGAIPVVRLALLQRAIQVMTGYDLFTNKKEIVANN